MYCSLGLIADFEKDLKQLFYLEIFYILSLGFSLLLSTKI